jgi:glutaconate CoA-transferase subunit A
MCIFKLLYLHHIRQENFIMIKKIMGMQDAVKLVKDGQLLGIGGNSLHRNPNAFCFELAKCGLKGLTLCGTAHGVASDVLCAVGAVNKIYFGFFGFENEYGLAPGMRKGCQESKIKAMEGPCTAIIAALRAGSYGVPFMPVAGLWGSQLLEQLPDLFRVAKSPFNGKDVVLVNALAPDHAIIHVHEADEYGNARIFGSDFSDILHSRAAGKTIITAEKIVDTKTFQDNPKLTSIPHFLVEAVVKAPGGAKPGQCFGLYDVADPAGMKGYMRAVKDGTLSAYLTESTKVGK